MRQLRRVLMLGAVVLLTGCMVHRPFTPQPAPDGSLGKYRIRAVLHDGSRVLVGEARIATDTLSGRRLWDLAPVALPMSDVQRVEVPRVSLRRTAALAVGAGLTWWLGAMWIDSQVVC
jgi:hypothetical protein